MLKFNEKFTFIIFISIIVMNKNLKLLLGVTLLSSLAVTLYSNKLSVFADAGYGYGYGCNGVYGYSNSCNVPAGGTYSSSSVGTVFSGWVNIPVSTYLENNSSNPSTTTTTVKNPVVIDISSQGLPTNTPVTNDITTDINFVLPNTWVN